MHVYLMTIGVARVGNFTIVSNTFVEFTIFVKVWFEDLFCLGVSYLFHKPFPMLRRCLGASLLVCTTFGWGDWRVFCL